MPDPNPIRIVATTPSMDRYPDRMTLDKKPEPSNPQCKASYPCPERIMQLIAVDGPNEGEPRWGSWRPWRESSKRRI